MTEKQILLKRQFELEGQLNAITADGHRYFRTGRPDLARNTYKLAKSVLNDLTELANQMEKLPV